jgi:hypothetical protein
MRKRLGIIALSTALLAFGFPPAFATPVGEVPDADPIRSILRSQLPRPLSVDPADDYLHYGIAFNAGQQALGNQISYIESTRFDQEQVPVRSILCDDYADAPCVTAQNTETISTTASVILPVCSDDGRGACLESISITKNGTTTEGNFLEYVDNSISNARKAQILQQETDCCANNPNNPALRVEFPTSPEWSADLSRGLPAAKSPSKWRVANIQNKGLTDTYMARATLQAKIDASGQVTFDNLSAEVIPYVETSNGTFYPPTFFNRYNSVDNGDGLFPGSPMYPIASFDNPNQVDPVTCAWEEELPTDSCGIAVQFADGSRTSMTIRIPSQLGGWFHGRVAKADLELNTYNSTLNRLVISAEDVDVPTAGASFPILDPAFSTYKDYFYANDPIGLQGIRDKEGNTPSDNTSRGLGSLGNWSADQGVDPFSVMEPLMGDTADGSVSMWQFATLPQSETESKCFANKNRIQGMISTNAMVYQAGLPSFGSQGFTYQVGGLRKDYSGQITKGSYSLIMRTEEARCLYGLGDSRFTSEVAVTDPSGANKSSQTSVDDDGTWLRIWADEFTYSSPRISTRLIKIAPTVAVPPTVSAPKIKIAAKKQLTVKSALSAQSLRYLAKVKAKPGDKIILSLQSGTKKNVDLKKSYIYFKKPGTYVVKVKVDRKTGPTVTRYIRVTVKK